jgi:hypothetical protein
MSNREWAALSILGALLVLVITVGLIRSQIDTTAVSLALITSIGGLMTGLIAKGRFGTGSGKGSGDEEEKK